MRRRFLERSPMTIPLLGVPIECTTATDSYSLPELLDRVRAGSQEAARDLHDRFSGHILRAIRRHFLRHGDPLRSAMDSTDLLQEAWSSVFEMLKDGRTFATDSDFARFMLTVTGNHSRKR